MGETQTAVLGLGTGWGGGLWRAGGACLLRERPAIRKAIPRAAGHCLAQDHQFFQNFESTEYSEPSDSGMGDGRGHLHTTSDPQKPRF